MQRIHFATTIFIKLQYLQCSSCFVCNFLYSRLMRNLDKVLSSYSALMINEIRNIKDLQQLYYNIKVYSLEDTLTSYALAACMAKTTFSLTPSSSMLTELGLSWQNLNRDMSAGYTSSTVSSFLGLANSPKVKVAKGDTGDE